jgi:hypothetical protein
MRFICDSLGSVDDRSVNVDTEQLASYGISQGWASHCHGTENTFTKYSRIEHLPELFEL